MPALVPVALASWVVLTVVLFARYKGRDAALVSLVAGWVLLPNAVYPPTSFGSPPGAGGSVHALAVPTVLLVNKATAIGFGGLVGLLLFDWPLLCRLRPTRLDLPVLVWCVVPIVSALANGLTLASGLAESRYLMLAWGVPYLLGRVYLVDSESLRRFGIGFVVAGLFFAPLALLEFLIGPFLYGLVYGPHPYQIEGAARAVGSRPLGFLEHGNQFGLLAAFSAVSAAWLVRSGRLRSVANVPGRVAAFGLTGLCAVYQSHGAILLTACALSPVALSFRRRARVEFRPVHATAVVLAVVLVVAGVVGLAGSSSSLRGGLKSVAVATGKGSFTWRLARYENHFARVSENPVLGLARADWSSSPGGLFVNPVNLGLWLHALGMFGLVGLAASTALFIAPVVEVVRWLPLRAWLNPACAPVTLVAVLLLVGLGDSLLNSTVVLPLLAGAGGLNSWSERRDRGN